MRIISAILLLFLVTSCVETVVVGSVATVVVVTRDKTMAETKEDVIIAAKIDEEFLENGLKSPKNSVGVMVNRGRVFLTGKIHDAVKGKQANELAWKISGVKEVIDEIELSDKNMNYKDFTSPIADSVITAALKCRLFFTSNVAAANYKLATVEGVVYVFGTSRSDSEEKIILAAIANTYGVKKVINHIIPFNGRSSA